MEVGRLRGSRTRARAEIAKANPHREDRHMPVFTRSFFSLRLGYSCTPQFLSASRVRSVSLKHSHDGIRGRRVVCHRAQRKSTSVAKRLQVVSVAEVLCTPRCSI